METQMSLTDSVNKLNDYLNESIKSANKAISGETNRATASASGPLKSSLQKLTVDNSKDTLKVNPILNSAGKAGEDFLNKTAKGAVDSVMKKANLTPIQNATKQFFTLFASITTFGPEVALELARNTANNIVTGIKKKDTIAQQINAEVTAIYNACAILLNGPPPFRNYLQDIINAYGLISGADSNLKRVLAELSKPIAPTFKQRTFDQSLKDLASARDILLPPNNTNVQDIRTLDFSSLSQAKQSVARVKTAFLSLAGMTLNLANLILQYEMQSLQVNGLINIFLTALDDYLSNYLKSLPTNQAAIDHITSGVSQLDALLAEMKSILDRLNGSPEDATIKSQLSTYGTKWGVSLTGTIEFLKLNPASGSAVIDKTTANVQAYLLAVKQISALTDITYPGGTVYVNKGQEDAYKGLVRPSAKYIGTVNTIMVTSTSRLDVRLQASAIRNYMTTSTALDAKIVLALQPFLNTRSPFGGDIAKSLGKLKKYANKNGLDRMAGILTSGDVKSLFSATPDTSTYAGAAVASTNAIIDVVKQVPGATTQLISKIETLRDSVLRKQKAQEQFAGRGAYIAQGAEATQRQAAVDSDKTLIRNTTEAAKQYDEDVAQDPAANTERVLNAKVTPGQVPGSGDVRAAEEGVPANFLGPTVSASYPISFVAVKEGSSPKDPSKYFAPWYFFYSRGALYQLFADVHFTYKPADLEDVHEGFKWPDERHRIYPYKGSSGTDTEIVPGFTYEDYLKKFYGLEFQRETYGYNPTKPPDAQSFSGTVVYENPSF
jgi:hypothetical protein